MLVSESLLMLVSESLRKYLWTLRVVICLARSTARMPLRQLVVGRRGIHCGQRLEQNSGTAIRLSSDYNCILQNIGILYMVTITYLFVCRLVVILFYCFIINFVPSQFPTKTTIPLGGLTLYFQEVVFCFEMLKSISQNLILLTVTRKSILFV